MNSGYDCDYLSAEDIDLLRRVYDEACLEKGINPGTPDADNLAYEIMLMFADGLRDADALKERLADKAA